MANPFAHEFEALLQQHTQGMDLAGRRHVLQQWLDDLTREGRVPTPGGWVSLTDAVATAAVGVPMTISGTATSRVPTWKWLLLAVATLGILATCMWMQGPASGGPTVPTTPVTAQDGATAPIALTLGGATLPVRRFDPTQGWPDPAATADAALWGATTINVVLGLDGRTHAGALAALTPGQILTLRRADGSVSQYAVTAVVDATAQAVEYAAQDHAGVTLVAFEREARTIITALPLEAPQPQAVVAGGTVTVGAGHWTTEGAQLALAFPVAVDPLTLPLQITLGDAVVPVTDMLVLPAAAVPATAGATLPLTLTVGTDVAPLRLVIPPAPMVGVTWQGVYRSADGRSVLASAVLAPDAPSVLTTTRGGCQADGGTIQPLQIMDHTLPRVLVDPQVVTVRCAIPRDARTLTVWLDDQSIAVALPVEP